MRSEKEKEKVYGREIYLQRVENEINDKLKGIEITSRNYDI